MKPDLCPCGCGKPVRTKIITLKYAHPSCRYAKSGEQRKRDKEIEAMAFEKFDHSSYHGASPMITVNTAGNFYLNLPAVKKHFEGYGYCELYFDKEKSLIGFKPSHDKTMAKIGRRGIHGHHVAGKRFMYWSNIDFLKTHRHEITTNNGYLIIGPVSTKPPGKEVSL